jgi:hypothetical protein
MRSDVGLEQSLSKEESEDLSRLIGLFRERPSQFKEELTLSEGDDFEPSVEEEIAALTVTVGNLDSEMAAVFRLVHLLFRKTEIMHKRIDGILELMEKRGIA